MYILSNNYDVPILKKLSLRAENVADNPPAKGWGRRAYVVTLLYRVSRSSSLAALTLQPCGSNQLPYYKVPGRILS
eukprot:scaffold45403_cov57-Attheya_sp.AAC.1